MKRSIVHSFLIFSILLGGILTGHAQEKKALALFEAEEYHEVLDFYTRNYREGLSSKDVRLMCESMLKVGLFQDALDLAQRTFLDKREDPDIILALCQALIYNGEFNTAYYMLEEYSDLDFDPDALYDIGRRAAILKDWEGRQASYDVTKLDGFNTELNEFSLYVIEGRRIFCSSQQKEGSTKEEYDRSKKEYTSLFEAAGDQMDHQPFNNGKFKGRFNVGPFEYTTDGFYFTFSAELSPGMNQLQIRKTDKDDPDAYNAEHVVFFKGDYNAAHPTFSPDGQRIIFSSDLPGGYGGMDLYYCVRTNMGWSAPINLGDVVNTAGNEVFPRLIDGQLYFSSNGHPGYGGLDIYVVTDDMHHEDIRNLYRPINTPFDDFGYFKLDESSGYFSSNRPGGEGGDDIYRYERIKVIPDPKLISGILEIEGIPQQKVKMVLLNKEGQIIEQAFTDLNGVFYFNRDPDGGNYQIRMDKLEEEEVQNANLFLTDSNGRKSKKLVADENGNFNFELLAVDDYFIDYLKVEDNTLFSFTMKAIVFREEPGDMKEGVDVFMLTDKGIISKQERTNDEGYFSFHNVIPQETYHFNVADEDKPLKMAILDEQGAIVKILEKDETGRFFYERPYEEGNFISLYNEDMELITIEKDAAIQLPDIFYDYNSWELNDQSKQALNKLVEILKNNQELEIELSSHTDSRGIARYNTDLSNKRAKAALTYIVGNGVDPKRIVAVGRGEESLLNYCKDGVSCSEDEHALNRRTEFKIRSY
ncbi:MAG: OmpA family protein [Bacteroidetes bacterium]|nr:OmpA family protein [Bacteroidota bacterium]MDA0972827.1 OmpA family protein [Bacteroidota bacterium]